MDESTGTTTRWMLKKGPLPGVIADVGDRPDDQEAFRDIRCPLCGWQPTPSSVWVCICDASDTPEPFFEGCGTMWNTFSTRGLCPGCAHQWRWTSCLRCGDWSLHDDWYEQSPGR